MKILALCSFLLTLNISSQAGVITFRSSLGCEVTPPIVRARLQLENNGNEAAYNIQTRFKIGDKSCLSRLFPKLEVNKKLEIECIVELEVGKKGIYPLVAKTHFQDGAGYRFTTLVATPLIYIEATAPNIFGRLADVALSDKDVLKLNVANTGYNDLNLDINILVPDELSVRPNQKQFLLKARTKKEIPFKLNNFSALKGAVYPAWAIIEYENQDKHFTHICVGNIEVKQKINANIFKRYWWCFLLLAALMMFVFIFINLRRQFH